MSWESKVVVPGCLMMHMQDLWADAQECRTREDGFRTEIYCSISK